MQTTTELSKCLNARQDEYRYLLLDPLKKVASWNPLHAARLNESKRKDALQRVLRPDLAWSPEHCPLLLLLASPGEQCDEELILSSEEYARGEMLYEKRYVCGWLSSKYNPGTMAEWLADLCRKIKSGSVIPVFEPLRLELLQITSDKDVLSRLLNPVSDWHILGSVGELITLSGQVDSGKWLLNWGTEHAQSEARNIWHLLALWKEITTSLPSDATRLAVQAWSKSNREGFHHLSDRSYLALNFLTLPVDITRHNAVKLLLREAVSNPEQRFTQLLRTLPDTVWQELKHGMRDAKEK